MMSTGMIEHRGIVQRVEGSKAIVAMETAGCSSCGQGSSCGIGKMASGRPATLITIPTSGDVRPGDFVLIGLPESKLTFSALLGYLFPAFAMLWGALLLGESVSLSMLGGAAVVLLGTALATGVLRLPARGQPPG